MCLDGLSEHSVLSFGPGTLIHAPRNYVVPALPAVLVGAIGKLTGDALPVVDTSLVHYLLSAGYLYPPWYRQQTHVEQGPLFEASYLPQVSIGWAIAASLNAHRRTVGLDTKIRRSTALSKRREKKEVIL